jgi:hypothetical protein
MMMRLASGAAQSWATLTGFVVVFDEVPAAFPELKHVEDFVAIGLFPELLHPHFGFAIFEVAG